jgi:hypothetical protein
MGKSPRKGGCTELSIIFIDCFVLFVDFFFQAQADGFVVLPSD